MVMPNEKEKNHKKMAWDTAAQVQNVKNSDTCLQRIWKLLIQFFSLTLANLPWKHPPDTYFSEQTLNSDLKMSEELQSSKAHLPIHHYLNIKQHWRWKGMISFAHLFLRSWSSMCWTVLWHLCLHFKGEETDSKYLRNLLISSKLLKLFGSTKSWI